jgi:hypothetical protein
VGVGAGRRQHAQQLPRNSSLTPVSTARSTTTLSPAAMSRAATRPTYRAHHSRGVFRLRRGYMDHIQVVKEVLLQNKIELQDNGACIERSAAAYRPRARG